MDRITIPKDCLVLVCDGSKAVFYKNSGDALAISLVAVDTLEERHPPTRELGADRPGRAVDSMDGSRSAMEETDWHRVAEERFLRSVGAHLDEVIRTQRTTTLVVVALPRALGVLGESFTVTARKVLKAEIPKELVNTPKPKLESYLQSLSS